MKREFFGMLFIVLFVALSTLAEYLFGEELVMDKLRTYIVIWVLLGFFVGQYSMKFPKAF